MLTPKDNLHDIIWAIPQDLIDRLHLSNRIVIAKTTILNGVPSLEILIPTPKRSSDIKSYLEN